MPEQKLYDAFLSHNNNDKPVVEQIAVWLRDQAKLKVWFDKWNVLAGDVWQEEIEKALDQSRSCVVFLGPAGLGGWHNEEMRSAIEDRVAHKEMRVIPVLLPNTKIPEKESGLARFLRRHSYVEFRHDVNDDEALKRLAAGITGKQAGESASRLYETVCPFRGLEVFREEHKDYFFGRDNVVQRLQHYLQDHCFLAVIGPSGSGKSSVVQAGLIPALKNRGSMIEDRGSRDPQSSIINPPSSILNPRSFRSVLFTPQTDPFEGLAFALRPLMTQPPSYSQLIKDLTDNRKELEYITRGICRDTDEARLLLVIDQFEEVFTQTADEHKRQRFFDSLLNTVEAANNPTFIVLTMRSDFLGKCAAYADLNTFIIDHLFQIGPMSAKDLREAIEEPAQRVGLEFEKGLVEIMLRDAAGAPGELPLIEHALLELYERRIGNQLTQAAYAEIGGISGALAKRAETEFARLTPAQQEILRKMFVLRLIQPGEEGIGDLRRRASKEELLATGVNAKEVETVLQLWTQARLLTASSDPEKKQEWVEVAHEALIRTWPKVQDWLKDERENTRLFGQLRQTVLEWERAGRNPDYLFHGARLAQLEELPDEYVVSMTDLEKAFIDTSIAQRDAEAKEKEEQRQRLANLLARNYWENGRRARADGNELLALHYIAEAIKTAPAGEDPCTAAQQDASEHLFAIHLRQGYEHEGAIRGAVFSKDETRILTWSEDGSARLWQAGTGDLIGQPLQHKEAVHGALFSKDENRILTWSNDGSARLWQADNGDPVGQPLQHKEAVYGALFSKDENRILTRSKDGSARLWKVGTGELLGQPMQHKETVSGAVFSKDETHILTWSNDGSARLWKAGTGEPLGQPLQHKEAVHGALFSKDETRILTWSDDGSARLWQAGTGEVLGQPMQHKKPVFGAIFSNDETRILTWSMDGSACLWEAETGVPIGQPMQLDKPVIGAMFSKNEKYVLTWGGSVLDMLDDKPSGSALLWHVEAGVPIGRPMQHKKSVWGAVFSKDEKRILTWSGDGCVRLWEAETGAPIGQPMQHEKIVKGAVFSQNEKYILTWSDDGCARLWETETGAPIGQPMQHKGTVNGALFSNDETRILTWSWDGSVRLWNTENRTPFGLPMQQENSDLKSVLSGLFGILVSFSRGAVFSKDGKRILTWSQDKNVYLREAETGIPIGQPMQHSGMVKGAMFFQEEERILTWGKDDGVHLWEAETCAHVCQLILQENSICDIVLSKDERIVLTVSDDSSARLWHADTGTPIALLRHKGKKINGAVFSQSEKSILTWSEDGSVSLWDTQTAIPISQHAIQHEKRVTGAVFSQNERYILTWSDDGCARLWEAETGAPIGQPMRHKGTVNGAVFSNDETRILTWSWDGCVCLWEAGARTGTLIAQPLQHKSNVRGTMFSKDEKRILTWTGDSSDVYDPTCNALFWDTNTCTPISQPMQHENSIVGAVFSRNEKRIITWSVDGSVRLWESETGTPIGHQPIRHDGLIVSIIFSQDEKRILTWRSNNTARLWDVPGDLDFPNDKYILQVQALTGTQFNPNTRQISVIPIDEWRKIQQEWLAFAREHAKTCQYKRQNVYLRFFATEEK